jgi:hypothetical protein
MAPGSSFRDGPVERKRDHDHSGAVRSPITRDPRRSDYLRSARQSRRRREADPCVSAEAGGCGVGGDVCVAVNARRQWGHSVRPGSHPRALAPAGEAPGRDGGVSSPSAESRPSSGSVAGGCGCGARGVLALQASPSAGVAPIRRRPSRPSPDRDWMLSSPGGSLDE